MSKPPAAMKTNGRPREPRFDPAEHLFRRVPLSIWDDPTERPGPEAVELPDMSVGRSKFGHAEWVRFDVVNGQHYEDWGILGVLVSDIPPRFWDLGVFQYTFVPCHDPEERDYPHSEVRAYNNGVHIRLADALPEDIHLKWRVALLREMDPIIKPRQKVPTREQPPRSHLLEAHTVAS